MVNGGGCGYYTLSVCLLDTWLLRFHGVMGNLCRNTQPGITAGVFPHGASQSFLAASVRIPAQRKAGFLTNVDRSLPKQELFCWRPRPLPVYATIISTTDCCCFYYSYTPTPNRLQVGPPRRRKTGHSSQAKILTSLGVQRS